MKKTAPRPSEKLNKNLLTLVKESNDGGHLTSRNEPIGF